nr:MAG TPA: hypothetical protein [Caudoviricetes sp.]
MRITEEGLEKVRIEFKNVEILTRRLNRSLKRCQKELDKCESAERSAELVLDAEDDILETVNLLKDARHRLSKAVWD